MDSSNYSPRIRELDKHIKEDDRVLLLGFMAHSPEGFERKLNDNNSVIEFVGKKCSHHLGLDIADGDYEAIRENYGFNVKKENFLDSDYEDEFDVVLAFKVLDHIPQIDTFYENVKKSLKPGGKLIIKDDNNRSVRRIFAWIRDYEEIDDDVLFDYSPITLKNHSNLYDLYYEYETWLAPPNGKFSPFIYKYVSEKLGSVSFLVVLRKPEHS